MKLGAHVSTAGGLDKAIARAAEIGCEAIQIFGSSPQSWAYKPVPEAKVSSFKAKAEEAGIDSVFFHAIYLINLSTADPAHLEKGIQSLINYMQLASEVGAQRVILHPGSHKGAGYQGILRQTISSINFVLDNSPKGPWLILENTAGMGQYIGAKLVWCIRSSVVNKWVLYANPFLRFEQESGFLSFRKPSNNVVNYGYRTLGELGGIIRGVSESHRGRVKVCLDTQHSFAAGYDIAIGPGLEAMMAEFDETIGVDNLVAVHANDSKYALGAGVDRHENSGQGYLGLQTFENLMSNAAFKDLPLLLEVPGADKKGPDKENLEILKEIRSRVAPAGLS